MSCRLAGRSTCAPFKLQFLRVTHSIPEAQALVIDTPHGLLLHTGDWKLDPQSADRPATDEAAFAALGERGVLAMIGDSTNAMVEGHSGSEAEVRRSLTALLRGLRGRVAVTCFASNVARIRVRCDCDLRRSRKCDRVELVLRERIAIECLQRGTRRGHGDIIGGLGVDDGVVGTRKLARNDRGRHRCPSRRGSKSAWPTPRW